jgi:tRNA threonylcarbamoyladenosine biosynthesis protein TsaB
MIGSTMAVSRDIDAAYALAFETSCAVGSVALGRGAEVLEMRKFGAPRAHAVEFLPTIDAMCRRHKVRPGQVGRVYVSSGPGSFTGLRIGVTAARMFALAHGTKLVAVPTLEATAQNAAQHPTPTEEVAVVLDAKRRRVYAAAFRREDIPLRSKSDVGAEEGLPRLRYVATCEPAEVDPAEFLATRSRECAVLGEGVLYHRDAVDASELEVLPESLYRPRAETVFLLGYERAERGEFIAPRDLTPVYIRPPEAEEVWARKHGE